MESRTITVTQMNGITNYCSGKPGYYKGLLDLLDYKGLLDLLDLRVILDLQVTLDSLDPLDSQVALVILDPLDLLGLLGKMVFRVDWYCFLILQEEQHHNREHLQQQQPRLLKQRLHLETKPIQMVF